MIKVIATPLPVGGRGDAAQDAYAKNIANGYAKLRGMARLYNLVAGNIPLVGYNRILYNTFWQSESERRKHFHAAKEELADPSMDVDGKHVQPVEESASKQAAAQAKEQYSASKPDQESSSAPVTDQQHETEAQKTDQTKIQYGRFHLTRCVVAYGDMYVTKVGLNGAEEFLFIPKKSINSMEPVRQSALLGLQPGATLSIHYEPGFAYGKATGLLFKGFAA